MAVREKIVKLAQKIAGTDAEYDETSPQYYALECVITDEMAELALTMDRWVPYVPEAVSERCGKSLARTKQLLDEMAYIGVIATEKQGDQLAYYLDIFVPGALEAMCMNKAQVEKYPQIARAFEELTKESAIMTGHLAPVGVAGMRVIPIETSLPDDSRAATYEQCSYWLEKYRDQIAVGDCSCRTSRRLLGEGCGHLEKDMCIALGDAADYAARTNRARKISYDEALDILRRAEENGLVHQVTNIYGEDKIIAICNCCRCSCYGLRNSQYYNTPNLSRSNFVAEVDPKKCVACGQCVENCPANSVKLGQKICGDKPIEIPVSPLPDDNEWGPEQWNPDYRDSRVSTLETGTAPCKTACPAHIGVQAYIQLAAQGRYLDALELIKKDNPLPAVCGRICPHACESECTRGLLDEPIAIDEIKKFIADKELHAETRYIPKKRHDYGKRMAVIGSGPAGLSCAYYLALDGYRVTVFEKEKKLGGMLTLGIPSFRLEKDVVNTEIEVLREMGVTFQTGIEVGKDLTLDYLRAQKYEAFFVAIGAQKGRALGLDGEDAQGVISGVDFLRAINLGNEMTTKGKVLVIGGGNVAIDVARTATRTGSDSVSLFCLESQVEMPALDEEVDEARQEGVCINNAWGPKRLITENGRIKGVEFRKCLSVFDKNKRFSPKYDETETLFVEADYVLTAIGQAIDWGQLLNNSTVELHPNRTAAADALTLQTGQPDVFVGGDVYTGPSFAIDAIVSGKEAAISMHRYVWEGQSLTLGRDRRIFKTLDKDNLSFAGFDTAPRQRIGHTPSKRSSFNDTRLTFTEEQLKKETERCLGCGAAVVDQNRCLGCGLCVTKCKMEAISLTRKFDAPGLKLENYPEAIMTNAFLRQERIEQKAAAAANK